MRILSIVVFYPIFAFFYGCCKSEDPELSRFFVNDIDGNSYRIVTIGTQTWMAENLRTTKYSDGTSIPLITENTTWESNGLNPAYCWYNNNATFKTTYGALYNWVAVNSATNGNKNICPTGWHIPNKEEWTTLGISIGTDGSFNFKSGKLRETGTTHWQNPNAGATNEFGFTALPGGYRSGKGMFFDLGRVGYWWSATGSFQHALKMSLNYDGMVAGMGNSSQLDGLSVRCVTLTSPTLPTLTTTEASLITETTATTGGSISSDANNSITVRGVCWSTSPNPTTALTTKTSDGIGTGVFASNLTGLAPSTTYYVRAYATNRIGTAYGNEVCFTSLGTSSISDIDGNSYRIVTIGTQTWMAENLRTTKYSDGTSIPLITENAAWVSNGLKPTYCWYNNDATYKTTYGALYNWFAVSSAINGNKNICPAGWHVPTDAEWTTLTTYLGGAAAAGKLKEAGIIHWQYPNTGATNESGFTALPGGYRADYGTFFYLTYYGRWWSVSSDLDDFAWTRNLDYLNGTSTILKGSYNKKSGLSVRCTKD